MTHELLHECGAAALLLQHATECFGATKLSAERPRYEQDQASAAQYEQQLTRAHVAVGAKGHGARDEGEAGGRVRCV